jgi:hypothetical protein
MLVREHSPERTLPRPLDTPGSAPEPDPERSPSLTRQRARTAAVSGDDRRFGYLEAGGSAVRILRGSRRDGLFAHSRSGTLNGYTTPARCALHGLTSPSNSDEPSSPR